MGSQVWDEITYPFLNFNGSNRWSLGMDKYFHPTLYNGWNYLSMPGFKLNHVSKNGHLLELKSINVCHVGRRWNVYVVIGSTNLARVTHICVCNLTIIGPDNGIMAWSAPGHYLNQCWTIANWTLKGNPYRNSIIHIQEFACENVINKMAAIFLGLNVLNWMASGWFIWRCPFLFSAHTTA